MGEEGFDEFDLRRDMIKQREGMSGTREKSADEGDGREEAKEEREGARTNLIHRS